MSAPTAQTDPQVEHQAVDRIKALILEKYACCSRIRRRQWNQRPKNRPNRRRIRVSATESTIDVTIGK